MRITNTIRKTINRRVRELSGANPLAEVGVRDNAAGQWVANGLNWVADADLGDLRRLADLKTIDDCPALPGCATLDLYVTSGVGHDRELEHNVYVTIKAGAVVDVHTRSLDADARCEALLGVPFSASTPADAEARS